MYQGRRFLVESGVMNMQFDFPLVNWAHFGAQIPNVLEIWLLFLEPKRGSLELKDTFVPNFECFYLCMMVNSIPEKGISEIIK